MLDRPPRTADPVLLDTGSWDEVSLLFDNLVDLPDVQQAERLAGVEPAIRQQVERLLAASVGSGLLDRPVTERSGTSDFGWLPQGERIGAFEIVRPLGRGGMGEVYLASRADGSFAQSVALKLLRIDAVDNVAEFERERELLARMDHPGIARLIDGGILASGRPWMAMEFVAGEAITAWARQHRSTLEKRLALFDQVAQAVAYAHANLVIHRDIKPGNVLVDDSGRVRLLDFGIAKLTGEIDADAAATQALMTPYYAAPEQLSGEAITTATDVHGLGLLLHHLLAGAGPWGEAAGLGLMVRRVIDDEPPPPSRTTDPAAGGLPRGQLEGDINAIVAMALRKRPEARYGSVAEMRADLERFQSGRPVVARARTWRYRAKRYIGRNRWQVAAGVALALSLAGGAGLFAWQAQRAGHERDMALAEARRSDAIIRVLNGVFAEGRSLDPGGQQTAKELLRGGTLRLMERMGPDARSGASAVALADMFIAMQDPVSSGEMLRSALARGIGADDPLATGRMQDRLAAVAMMTGGPEDLDTLIAQASAALSLKNGATEADLLSIARLKASRARMKGDYDTALSIVGGNVDRARRVYSGSSGELLTFYNNALIYAMEGNRLDLAREWFAQVGSLLAQPDVRDTIEALGVRQLRGVYALRLGNAAEAVTILSSVSDRRRATYGESAGLGSDLVQLAKAQMATGNAAGALTSATEGEALFARLAGPAAPPTLAAKMIRAEAVAAAGNPAEGEAILARVAGAMAAIPSPSLYAGQFAISRAGVAISAGKTGEAEERIAEAKRIFGALGPSGQSARQGIARLEQRLAKR
jgi:eukaryotic-like serine/threonine-protein kinase